VLRANRPQALDGDLSLPAAWHDQHPSRHRIRPLWRSRALVVGGLGEPSRLYSELGVGCPQ
jgi:hypothetical protein